MAKNLIIVESPAKVKTIKKFLSRDFAVEASVGHVRDLPSSRIGVDEAGGFVPEYDVIPGKQKVVAKLKAAAEKAENIYLAPDPDREGEAIAWHVAELLKPKKKNDPAPLIRRIQFNEITSRAVREALEHPRDLDEQLFNSQQARRILDRLVGYKLSPLLWQKVKRGISAGRVQSVALRLIVDRERERQAFVPEEYWLFKARLATAAEPDAPFTAELAKVGGKKAAIGNADAAQKLYDDLLAGQFQVAKVEEKERAKSPPPPFITSTLQQEANRKLGFGAKRTMGAAQRLYEGVELGEAGTTALITYMRTDSVRIAEEARDAAKVFITEKLGPEYYPDKARQFKVKAGAQDAHEAIRPVDVNVTPEAVKNFLPPELFKLYALVWKRFVASQMAAAKFWDTTAAIANGRTEWRAKGQRLTFPGYLKVYGLDEDDASSMLPRLEQGMDLQRQGLTKEQKFTQPPPRYTEASLVKEMEELGIGRPSTYAATLSTIVDRDYARLEDKKFVPSELGFTVSELLAKHFTELMDAQFTAGMEEKLDEVASGKVDWVQLLAEFTAGFYPSLKTAQKEMVQVKGGLETNVTCELCGKPMAIRFGKNGEFLGCSGYPECKNIRDFSRDAQGNIVLAPRREEVPQKAGTCPKCGKDLVVKKSRTGSRFLGCSGYPECDHTAPFSTGVACPREGCDGELVEKSSRRGKVFYSCNTYPKCDYATWDWPVAEPCPECDSKILVRKKDRSGQEYLACPTRGCRYRRELASDAGEPQDGTGEPSAG